MSVMNIFELVEVRRHSIEVRTHFVEELSYLRFFAGRRAPSIDSHAIGIDHPLALCVRGILHHAQPLDESLQHCP